MSKTTKDRNPWPVSVTGSNLVEQLTEADVVGGDLTFSAAVEYIDIYNRDGTNTGEFVVNGVTLVVPAGAALGPVAVQGTASAVVGVTGSTSYIVTRLS